MKKDQLCPKGRADLTWFRRLLLFTLNSSLQELQRSPPCHNANGSSGYSFTRWAGLMPFGSDVVAPPLVRFPFEGEFVHTLRFPDAYGVHGLSKKEATCTSSTSVVRFKTRSLLELQSGNSAIVTRAPPRPHVAEYFHYFQLKCLLFRNMLTASASLLCRKLCRHTVFGEINELLK